MSKGLWHLVVITLLILILALVGYIAWRFWKLRHPVVVYVPPPEPLDQISGFMDTIVDLNMETRNHVAGMADKLAHDEEMIKVETRRIASWIRKLGQAMGFSGDDIP
jgi:hypothetical protein